jgi:hypothetical protein
MAKVNKTTKKSGIKGVAKDTDSLKMPKKPKQPKVKNLANMRDYEQKMADYSATVAVIERNKAELAAIKERVRK